MIEGLEFVLVELEKFQPATWTERKLVALWLRFLKEVNEGMRELPQELAVVWFEKVVVNSFKAGYSIDAIVTITGLTSEQIIEILKRNNLI